MPHESSRILFRLVPAQIKHCVQLNMWWNMDKSGPEPEPGPGIGSEPGPGSEPGLMQDYLQSKRCPSPSGVSLKSDRSNERYIGFKSEQSRSSSQLRNMDKSGPEPGPEPGSEPGQMQDYLRSKADPSPSGVSLKSDQSNKRFISFKSDKAEVLHSSGQFCRIQIKRQSQTRHRTTAGLSPSEEGPGPSGVSLRRNFADGQDSSPELRSEDRSVPIGQEPQTELDSIFQV
ncbi:hypothetical protein WMY93_032259 [Mugilogobius chulae]|uniref:Uncharacterized protein n=1 Tax=Mugilogobius chulae TaxID=88201 RepID=A0AAW0MEP4_9GOBI